MLPFNTPRNLDDSDDSICLLPVRSDTPNARELRLTSTSSWTGGISLFLLVGIATLMTNQT